MRLFAVMCVAVCIPATAAFAGGSGGFQPPPPVIVAGGRSVETRNESGGLTKQTSIPGSSEFSTYGGGHTSTCQFTAATDGEASNGQPYVAGQVVISSKWLFREVPSSFSPEPSPGDNSFHGDNRGPLADAIRYFAVYCDTRYHLVNATIGVPVRDPMLDPRPRAADLYNGLQLERPVVFRNPVVDRWGGLVTRYPAWLAVQATAWRPQRSNADHYLGWTLLLLTEPSAMEFEVRFVPDPAKPSAPFSGVVPCVAAGTAPVVAPDGPGAFPEMPELAEQTEPGINGACMWTPPGPGTVTIQARITYTVTFWANGYTEPEPDYVWTSEPVTFTTGELAAVNTNG